MRKILPFVFLLLLAPALVRAANSLDEANDIRGSMNNPDGSADYIQQQYLSGSNTGGVRSTTANQPASMPNASMNNPNNTSGVSIDAVAASNPNQIDDGRDLLQSEQDLQASREKSLMSYCMTLVISWVAMIFVYHTLRLVSPQAAVIFLLASALALTAAAIVGLTKVFHNYPDGINPSNGIKTVCALILGTVLMNMWFFNVGIIPLIAFLAVGFSMIKGGGNKKLAGELVSGKQETAADIEARAKQYRGEN
ncbi:MAG: hypothetical protein FWF35_00590 [Elusimicrobia bacterium]|nr:hypothetical protein [Elusimicrobiota bacterium]